LRVSIFWGGFNFIFVRKVFAKFNFGFRKKILEKVRKFRENFHENLIFAMLEPLRSAKMAIQKLLSSLLTVAHQVYKLTSRFSMFFLAHFCQIYTFAKVFMKTFCEKLTNFHETQFTFHQSFCFHERLRKCFHPNLQPTRVRWISRCEKKAKQSEKMQNKTLSLRN
jgi:hypothetical protein